MYLTVLLLRYYNVGMTDARGPTTTQSRYTRPPGMRTLFYFSHEVFKVLASLYKPKKDILLMLGKKCLGATLSY